MNQKQRFLIPCGMFVHNQNAGFFLSSQTLVVSKCLCYTRCLVALFAASLEQGCLGNCCEDHFKLTNVLLSMEIYYDTDIIIRWLYIYMLSLCEIIWYSLLSIESSDFFLYVSTLATLRYLCSTR